MKGLTEGRDVRGTRRLDCDVVVVGSGAGGAAAAHELAGAGLTVLILEAGPWVRPEEFTQREIDTVRRIYVDQGAQGPGDGSLAILQGSCVGGSTVINGEVCFRTPDYVLEEWARDFGVRDMSPRAMAPVFEDVERMIHVTANDGRYREPGRRVDDGMRKLGLEPKPIARNVKGCKGCVYCFWGCAYGCKQSMDQSYLPAATGHGAQIYSDAAVTGIDVDGGRARGVTARTPHGAIEVRSRAVVLAAGAIATPLLLIDHRLGGSDAGRNLAVHPVLFTSGLFDEPRTQPGSALLASYCDAFTADGFLIETGGGSRAFSAPFMPGFGRAHKEMVRDALARVWGGGAILRDRNGPGRVRRDRFGGKVIDYRLDAETARAARTAMKRIGEILFAGGAEKVWFPTTVPAFFESERDLSRVDSLPLGPADIAFASYHPQGTARLGTVTDHDGQVRGAPGLYVMDASLFPTPVGVNPQISVMGVATVLARKLAARLRRP